ncbi:MAG: 50S ribosomal protein L25 [Euzebyales bacterium]|jgi:large subunit ribosomal protein L25|nr:50S ribosomal protein L25 [Euzebyales bacterium]
MAERVPLTAARRVGSGKGEARSLRREGRVPAVAYGADLDPTPVSVDERELYHVLHTDAGQNAIIRLDVEGDEHLAMARELQRHPVRRDVLHVDFVTVNQRIKVHVDIPIHLEGAEDAPGADEGGVVEQSLFSLPINVLPLEVPDSVTLDVSDMQVGDVKRVEDLDLAEGVDVLEDAETSVVSVVIPQLDIPEPEEVEDAEEVEEGVPAEAEGEGDAEAAEGDEE